MALNWIEAGEGHQIQTAEGHTLCRIKAHTQAEQKVPDQDGRMHVRPGEKRPLDRGDWQYHFTGRRVTHAELKQLLAEVDALPEPAAVK